MFSVVGVKVVYKSQLKLNDKGVYLQFECGRIQASLDLCPCTNFAVNDKQWQLETSKKMMLFTDDEHFHRHKNRSDTCSS